MLCWDLPLGMDSNMAQQMAPCSQDVAEWCLHSLQVCATYSVSAVVLQPEFAEHILSVDQRVWQVLLEEVLFVIHLQAAATQTASRLGSRNTANGAWCR